MEEHKVGSHLQSSNDSRERDRRSYYGALLVFVIVIGLLFSLSFVEIPQSNNDVFKTIIGVIIGSFGMVISSLVGRDPNEVQNLKMECDRLKIKNAQQLERIDNLERMLVGLQSQIIDRLSSLEKDK